VAVVVLAGGRGNRFGGELNKAYEPLAGRPVISWSLASAARVRTLKQIVVVTAQRDKQRAERVIANEQFEVDARLVVGGSTRHESEWRALQDLAANITAGRLDIVVIHDAARPLAESRLFDGVIASAHRHGGGVPVRPATALIGMEKPSADDPVAVQTPQAFRATALLKAYELADKAGFTGTDTASCVERFSDLEIHCVPGSSHNIKITYPGDLRLAAHLLSRRG
jgi:2-C-methyl-D-erythritol 4-phosphate cytidylyltransferase